MAFRIEEREGENVIHWEISYYTATNYYTSKEFTINCARDIFWRMHIDRYDTEEGRYIGCRVTQNVRRSIEESKHKHYIFDFEFEMRDAKQRLIRRQNFMNINVNEDKSFTSYKLIKYRYLKEDIRGRNILRIWLRMELRRIIEVNAARCPVCFP